MNPQTVKTAFKTVFDDIQGVQVYDYPAAAPNLPAIVIYCEKWPYDTTAETTFVAWCLTPDLETAGAAANLNEWFGDDGPNSLFNLVKQNTTLNGVVSAAWPVEARGEQIVSMADGRRVLQTQVAFSVIR